MSPSVLGILALLAAPPASTSSNSPHGYWIQAVPASPEEAALREALRKAAFGGPAATVESLREVWTAYPGTAVSGLARLAAGLALVESERPADAVPLLTHDDIQRTALTDHALLALGRATEKSDPSRAAEAYLVAAGTPALACPALFAAGDAFVKAALSNRAIEPLTRALSSCMGQEPRALLALGAAHEARGDRRAAVAAYATLDGDYPASTQARDAAARLRALGDSTASLTPEARAAQQLKKALLLFEAGRFRDAVAVLRLVPLSKLPSGDADLARVRLGRALVAAGRPREAEAALRAVPPQSPHAAEAAYALARGRVSRGGSIEAYDAVARGFPGTPWGEEALLALANNYQKDQRDEEALPYYRWLAAEYPDGRYAERATWKVAWADYRAGRFEEAAQSLERIARLRPPGPSTPGFLYWAGRSRAALGQNDRARQLLEETVQRFKNAYHGTRAREALARLPPGASAPAPVLVAAGSAPASEVPEPQQTRVRQLLLIDRLDEAGDELRTLPFSPRVQATLAWIDWRRGRLRPAIMAMKKAYPEYIGEAGSRLPDEVWRILYPLQFEEVLKAKAAEEDLDPALVAALVCQESTFEPGAISRAGARGLMQVVPATGRKLARELGVRYRQAVLYNPVTSLDFGTRYLRQMEDRFGGRVEQVLAAYNAGPHRVDAWTAGRPEMSAEEFIESIPFTETRYYVMAILASREQYRRLYGLSKPASVAVSGGAP